MTNLWKFILTAAPVIAVILIITLWQQREHVAKQEVQHQKFERDWNEFQADFAGKDDPSAARYQQRAALAQTRASSAQADLDRKSRRVDQAADDAATAVRDVDQQLERAERKGR